MITHRSEIVLGAMAAGPRHAYFDPVRMQKLLFLIDVEIPDLIGGPFFDFQPYNFGPFDIQVYFELEELTASSRVHTDRTWRYDRYRLTDAGLVMGNTVLRELPETARRFVDRACQWMLAVSFDDLLSAIYRRYPDMGVRSIVPRVNATPVRSKRQTTGAALLTGMARTLDVMGTLDQPNVQPRGDLADAGSIGADWQAVGNDMRVALDQQAERDDGARQPIRP